MGSQVGFWWNDEGLFPVEDLLTSDWRLVRKERRIADEHLKKNDATTPPVNCLVISSLSKHLGSDIVRCTDGWIGKFATPSVTKFLIKNRFKLIELYWKLAGVDIMYLRLTNLSMLAKPKVGKFDVSVLIEKNVIRFKVSMDVIHFVDSLNCQDCLRYVKATFFFR